MAKKINNEGIERRNFNTSEIRVDNEDTREVVGYASVFNSLSENLGGFREVISRNAFDDVLENGTDTRALFNHDPNLILGRTTAGTLNLSVDENGLQYRFTAPNTTYANDLLESLKRGDVSQSSFGFIVEDDSWDQDENGSTIRTIKKVSKLLDVSPVSFPAYPESSAKTQKRFLDFRTEVEKTENKKQDKDQIQRELLNRKLTIIKLKK